MFDAFPYLQQMSDQFRRMFGDDFVRNLMNSMQAPNWSQGQGGPGNTAGPGDPFASRFGGGTEGGAGANNAGAAPGPGGGWTGEGAPNWNPFASGTAGFPAYSQRVFPTADAYETRHEVVLVLEVPGLERSSDIRLSVFPDHVIVKGEIERRYGRAAEGEMGMKERFTGSFERTIALPARVRRQHAKAVYRTGLLEVRLLKEGKSTEGEGSALDVDFA